MIMPISTSGIGNMDISSSSASKAKQKAEEEAMDAFASLMNMTATNDDNQVVDIQDMTNDYSKNNVVDDVKNEYNVNANVENKYAVKETDTSKDTKSSLESSTNAEKTDLTVDEVVTEETIANVAEVLKAVEELIVEELNITPEELDTLLQDMNLSLEDLLNPVNMRDFILQLNGSTNVDLLINEDLAGIVKDVCSKVENLLEELNITDTAEFVKLVESIGEQLDTYMSEVEPKVVEESVSVVADENLVSVTEETSDDVVKVEVIRDNQSTNNSENVMKSDTNADTISSDTQSETGTKEFSNQNGDTNSIVNNLNQAIENAVIGDGVEGVASYTDAVQEADIIRQIIDDIKVHLSKETTSIEVQLNPEHLGKVQINVAAKDGIMQAQIIAETEAAKNAIENSIAVLRETFNNQELKVEAIEVMVATYEFFNKGQEEQYQNEEQNPSSNKLGGINLNDGVIEEDMSEEEQLQVEIMKAQGNRVNYSI